MDCPTIRRDYRHFGVTYRGNAISGGRRVNMSAVSGRGVDRYDPAIESRSTIATRHYCSTPLAGLKGSEWYESVVWFEVDESSALPMNLYRNAIKRRSHFGLQLLEALWMLSMGHRLFEYSSAYTQSTVVKIEAVAYNVLRYRSSEIQWLWRSVQ